LAEHGTRANSATDEEAVAAFQLCSKLGDHSGLERRTLWQGCRRLREEIEGSSDGGQSSGAATRSRVGRGLSRSKRNEHACRQAFRGSESGRGAALVTFIMAGDPDYDTSLAIAKALPRAGADIIEIGMPFTDPMADGPAIQAAGLRALKSGQGMTRTLSLVREFREDDDLTPVILMGYYNPIYIYGSERFLTDAKAAGVDGLIVVDLPPEEDEELCLPALKAGLNLSDWRHPQPMTSVCVRCVPTRPALSITSWYPASPAPRRRTQAR
jgi:hypothetical protein